MASSIFDSQILDSIREALFGQSNDGTAPWGAPRSPLDEAVNQASSSSGNGGSLVNTISSYLDDYNRGFDRIAPTALPLAGAALGVMRGHPVLGAMGGGVLSGLVEEFAPPVPEESVEQALAEIPEVKGRTLSSADIQRLVKEGKPISVGPDDTVDISEGKGTFNKYSGDTMLKNLWGSVPEPQDPASRSLSNELLSQADTLRRRGKPELAQRLIEAAGQAKAAGSETAIKRKQIEGSNYERAMANAQEAKNKILKNLSAADPGLLSYVDTDISGEKLSPVKRRKITAVNKILDDTFKNTLGPTNYKRYLAEGGGSQTPMSLDIPEAMQTGSDKSTEQMDEEDSSFNNYLLGGVGVVGGAYLAKKFGIPQAVANKLLKISPSLAKLLPGAAAKEAAATAAAAATPVVQQAAAPVAQAAPSVAEQLLHVVRSSPRSIERFSPRGDLLGSTVPTSRDQGIPLQMLKDIIRQHLGR